MDFYDRQSMTTKYNSSISTDDFLSMFATDLDDGDISSNINYKDNKNYYEYSNNDNSNKILTSLGLTNFNSNNNTSNSTSNNNSSILNNTLSKLISKTTTILPNLLNSTITSSVSSVSSSSASSILSTGSAFNASENSSILSATTAATTTTTASSAYYNYNDTLFYLNFNNLNITNQNISNQDIPTIQFNGTYPSGYTLTHIIIASIIVTILMIIIVVGNMLVIIAIATEKSLKNIQNWFIASLAVADFFLGLVIMPFSLANELMGYWIFGDWWCDIHSAMDVLLCTASIMNLCLISLDRYWSITKAVEYLRSRTPARAAIMITAVWIMSGLICIPPLLGWKVKRPEGQQLPQCQLSQDIGYVLYSALGSFYIPSCIMVFVYIRIYFAAKARARRGIKKQPRKQPNEQVTSFSKTPKKHTIPMPNVPSTSVQKQQQIATIETQPAGSANMPIPIVTCDLASDISTSEAGEIEYQQEQQAKETLKVSALAATTTPATPSCGQNSTYPTSNNSNSNSNNNNNNINNNNNNSNHSGQQQSNGNGCTPTTTINPSGSATTGCVNSNELKVSPITNRQRALSVGIDTDMVSEFDPSSSDSGVVSRCAVVKPLKFRLCQPIFGRSKNQRRNEAKTVKNNTNNKPSELISAELEPAIPKIQKQRDPEKEKRRIARKKEKRATLILGLIMGSFIACWLPFFFLYILTPACPDCEIPSAAFAIAFWLGYMNSALNPAIYTIFNKDFRRAFRRILFK